MKTSTLVWLLGVCVVAACSFYAGGHWQQWALTLQYPSNYTGPQVGSVGGEVVSITGNNVDIKLDDGSIKTIPVTSDTVILSAPPRVSFDAITVGAMLSVVLTSDSPYAQVVNIIPPPPAPETSAQ